MWTNNWYVTFGQGHQIHKVVPIQNACVGKRGVTQQKIYGIGSKVNQFIYILICNYVKYQDPSLSGSSDILFTRLFIHSRKRGLTPERQDCRRKKKRVRLFFMYMPHINFKNFVHKVVPIQNACVRKRGVTQPKTYRIGSKVYQFIYTLVCNYIPNIRILAKAVLQVFCSQGCSYTKCLCPKKGNNSTENLQNRFKSLSVHLHLDLYVIICRISGS